ncbi:MAG: CRISPR-associated protein [Okeania sp. SIO3I5]|uniref:type III-B CRISPR module-associated Cmr3 family protein n=1 Tax=Okeania sp. SIO3I5 TaxID=2607805 RepID=UPI0013BC8C32|nr:type III-B CRISPR module-associated Cmr3 family protein [Okeania sp. SIO3I5]NEQ39946.1 CRISPR-associated protein [Okeania sp. SIO3I5]
MFKYIITVQPLGLMYGSSGGFLSAENLVGCSRAKFPPDAATLSGLILSYERYINPNKDSSISKCQNENCSSSKCQNEDFSNLKCLHVAGPFWAKENNKTSFYVPIPWTKIIGEKGTDEWIIKDDKWYRHEEEGKSEIEPKYHWLKINYWNKYAKDIVGSNKKNKKGSMAESPWKSVSILHPRMKYEERNAREKDGLFLEYAVQMPDDVCLVYLSTHSLEPGWYKFGGENHVVEINSIELSENDLIIQLLKKPIQNSFALITPAVWGSNRLSYRTPQHSDFPPIKLMLTDKAIPYRYRTQGRLGRGRYAVPGGSVYVLEESLNKSWWEWPEEWFPQEGISLKKVGSGLCLPLDIDDIKGEV